MGAVAARRATRRLQQPAGELLHGFHLGPLRVEPEPVGPPRHADLGKENVEGALINQIFPTTTLGATSNP